MTFREYQAALERRKAELGITGNDFVPPNPGTLRTPEKRALLKALEEIAAKSGRKPPFKAKY